MVNVLTGGRNGRVGGRRGLSLLGTIEKFDLTPCRAFTYNGLQYPVERRDCRS